MFRSDLVFRILHPGGEKHNGGSLRSLTCLPVCEGLTVVLGVRARIVQIVLYVQKLLIRIQVESRQFLFDCYFLFAGEKLGKEIVVKNFENL